MQSKVKRLRTAKSARSTAKGPKGSTPAKPQYATTPSPPPMVLKTCVTKPSYAQRTAET
jgi:hypothetical protein